MKTGKVKGAVGEVRPTEIGILGIGVEKDDMTGKLCLMEIGLPQIALGADSKWAGGTTGREPRCD